MSENPTQTQPAVISARPATTGGGEPYGSATSPGVDRDGTTAHGPHWTPLLPRKALLVLLAVGVVAGIAGPILLWLNFGVPRSSEFSARTGFLLLIIGLGLVLIAVPLVIGEIARLDTAASIGGAGDPRVVHADPARGLTGSRVVAVVGIVLVVAGAFLIRPVEPAASTGGGSSQGGNNQGGGN